MIVVEFKVDIAKKFATIVSVCEAITFEYSFNCFHFVHCHHLCCWHLISSYTVELQSPVFALNVFLRRGGEVWH